ncbi:hypothetical protein CRUP_038687 [Coryphaenoides rupestris]|nr:hypothetical protein CRUP_038687 [Coryphaenoides rupestris]
MGVFPRLSGGMWSGSLPTLLLLSSLGWLSAFLMDGDRMTSSGVAVVVVEVVVVMVVVVVGGGGGGGGGVLALHLICSSIPTLHHQPPPPPPKPPPPPPPPPPTTTTTITTTTSTTTTATPMATACTQAAVNHIGTPRISWRHDWNRRNGRGGQLGNSTETSAGTERLETQRMLNYFT